MITYADERTAAPVAPVAPVPPVAAFAPVAPVAESRPSKERGLWGYLRVSLSIALLLLMLGLAAVTIVIPALTHSVPLTVLTSSMEPKYPPGTLIIVKPVDPADLRIGDVATYQIRSGEPDVITHRVTAIMVNGIGERSFTFQGDNNNAPDPDAVREVQIQGRLWYSIPYMGWVNSWVNGDNRAWIIPVVAGGLFAYAAWMVVAGAVGSRRKKRDAAGRAPGRHAA